MSPGLDPQAASKLAHQLVGISKIPKCTGCSCLRDTARELASSLDGLTKELPEETRQALSRIAAGTGATHGCLGCNPCYPVNVANRIAEAVPEKAEVCCASGGACETRREEWPYEPGDYVVGNRNAPVAVSTLASTDLPMKIAERIGLAQVALAGRTETENIGVEKVVKNLIANPAIRVLLVCGKEPEGHRSGQTLLALSQGGMNADHRIEGSRGRKPVTRNLTLEAVTRFRKQVRVVDRIGNEGLEDIARTIEECARTAPGPYEAQNIVVSVPRIQAQRLRHLVLDRAGFLILYPDREREVLTVEHYQNDGTLNEVIEGSDIGTLYATITERGLISRLDHAAYIGCELARAEMCLLKGWEYIQDRAPGDHKEKTS